MSYSSRKKILNRKKQQKITARQKFLGKEPTPDMENTSLSEESGDNITAEENVPVSGESAAVVETPVTGEAFAEKKVPATEEAAVTDETLAKTDAQVTDETDVKETPVTDDDPETGDIPEIIQQALTDEAEPLLKKIKMEITFADESTINKEIIISGGETKEAKPPDDAKMPWAAAIVLAVIVCASLATGVYHWYNSYFAPADAVEPAHIAAGDERAPEENANEPANDNINTMTEQEETDPPDEPDLPAGQRYPIEPLPEFLQLWEEHGNEDIVAVLTLGETEIVVVQSNDNAFYITHDINRELSSQGWVFLDHQVDLYTGLEHNMVIYDPVGEFLRQVLQEYAEYSFFLRNPTITLSTLFGEIEWEIFSYYVAPADFPFTIVDHPDDDIWGEMIEQFTIASLYNTRLDVNEEDQILTIVVPTSVNPELFYVLQARMLRQITS